MAPSSDRPTLTGIARRTRKRPTPDITDKFSLEYTDKHRSRYAAYGCRRAVATRHGDGSAYDFDCSRPFSPSNRGEPPTDDEVPIPLASLEMIPRCGHAIVMGADSGSAGGTSRQRGQAMIAVRIVAGLLAVVAVGAVLGSVLRTVVLPRAVPARLARIAFLSVRGLLRLRLRFTGRADYPTRDRVFALQAPFGLFAQLFVWASLIWLLFAVIFWSLSALTLDGRTVSRALEQSGSSMLTLGFDAPRGLARQLTSFAAAGVGLTLLALVIAYIPTVYAAFSRREALITKLVVRTGSPPSGPSLLSSTWRLGRFDELDEVWDGWENWFIDVGESHTTFPQLAFFRSPRPQNHWVLATEAVLDGAALFTTACDVPRQSRGELCLHAGVHALSSIADFLGIPHSPPEPDAEIALSEQKFDQAYAELRDLGVPMRDDQSRSWSEFRSKRARYEPLLAVIGRLMDAPRSEWSSWSETAPRHRPPLLRPHRDGTDRTQPR